MWTRDWLHRWWKRWQGHWGDESTWVSHGRGLPPPQDGGIAGECVVTGGGLVIGTGTRWTHLVGVKAMTEAIAGMPPSQREGREQFLSSVCPPGSPWVFYWPIQPEFKQVQPMERWGMDLKTKGPRSGINIWGRHFYSPFYRYRYWDQGKLSY